MLQELNRRQFIARTAAAGMLAFVPGMSASAETFNGRIRKAMIRDVTESELEALKAAGFEGLETKEIPTPEEAAKGRALAEGMGLKIHSVLRGWMEFNSEDPQKVEDSLEKVRQGLRAAHAYGADALLVVPCRVNGMPMPEPWGFEIAFDEKTGHVTKVAEGDNSKYEAYMKAQNRATDTSRAAVEKLIPLAEELKVVIALENVWNNLWVQPALYAHFIRSFGSRWVQSYFDIGNHVKYAPPEQWIQALGPLIAKVHIKDFKLNPDGHGGKFVHPRDGSVDWPVVRRALSRIGYNGWATIEDGGLELADFSQRLDLILQGK